MKLIKTGSHSATRINYTRLLAVVIVVLLVLSGNRIENGLEKSLLDMAGLCCVTVASFGRVWAAVFISGYKTGTLISYGPYSVTRNPLYLFSLIGATGLGLATGSIFILGLVTILFALYYPIVIRREEIVLRETHGAQFQSYMARVPRFFPKPSLFSEPDTYTLNTKQFRRSLFDASYFILAFGALELTQRLHEAAILPTLFRIP